MDVLKTPYSQTNKLLFDNLKEGIAKEKRLVSQLSLREKELQAKVQAESRQIRSEKIPEKKKELSFRIRSYHLELKSLQEELGQKRRSQEDSLDLLASLQKEISQKRGQQELAERELEKKLKQLVLHGKQEMAKALREKGRHDHQIKLLRKEKETVSQKVQQGLQAVEAVLRKDRQEQEARVLAAEKSLAELLRKRKSLQAYGLAKQEAFAAKQRTLRDRKEFIDQHLEKVKAHLSKGIGLQDSLFQELLKRWFSRLGRLRRRERAAYHQAEVQEKKIHSLVGSLVKELKFLREKWSVAEQRVQQKERDLADLAELEKSQKRLANVLCDQKELLKSLQANLAHAQEKQLALNKILAAEEAALQKKKELKQEQIKDAKRSFEETLSAYEQPAYQKSKISVGEKLQRISSLNQEIIQLQKSHDSDVKTRQQLREKVIGLQSSVAEINKKVLALVEHISRNNQLLQEHQRVSASLREEESSLKQIAGRMEALQRLKQAQSKKREQEKAAWQKKQAELEKEKTLSLQRALSQVQAEGERKLQQVYSRIRAEHRMKHSFQSSFQKQHARLASVIAKKEVVLEEKKTEAERNIARLRQQKVAVLRTQGAAKLAELQDEIKAEQALKLKIENSLALEERRLNEKIAVQERQFQKEKSLLLEKESALRREKSSLNTKAKSLQEILQRLEQRKELLEARADRAMQRRKEFSERLDQRDADLKQLNVLVEEKLKRMGEKRILRSEMHQLHLIMGGKEEKPRKVVKVVTKYKVKTKFKTIIKHLEKKGSGVVDKSQMKSFLKEMDTLLGKLPQKEIDQFSKSKEFKLYQSILGKYGVK